MGTDFAGTTDAALRTGRNGVVLDGELVVARKGVVLEAPDHGLELVEVGEVAVDRGELDRAHGIDAGEPALGEVADALGLHLAAAAARLGGDPRGHRLELVGAHRPPAGRAGQAAQQLLAVEALAPAVALEHVEARLLGALVGGEALAAAARTRAGGARRRRLGRRVSITRVRVGGAEGTEHTHQFYYLW